MSTYQRQFSVLFLHKLNAHNTHSLHVLVQLYMTMLKRRRLVSLHHC